MADFAYPVEAEYDEHGDVVRDELELYVTYNRFSFNGNGSYEIVDVKKRGGVRVEEPELKQMLGENAYERLEDAAHDDWLEYGGH